MTTTVASNTSDEPLRKEPCTKNTTGPSVLTGMGYKDAVIDFNSPNLFCPKVVGKVVILPSSWRDRDNE